MVTVEKVIVVHAGIEQAARSDTWGIVVVIFRPRCRYFEPRRPVQRWVARHQWSTV